MSKISNDLIEAYIGFYEDNYEVQNEYKQFVNVEGKGGELAAQDFDSWLAEWIARKIKSHSPKERLEVYLTWNGIIGYTNRIWSITQGEL